MTGRVVTIGNAMADVVAVVPRLPERGGDVLARSGRIEVGGGGFRALLAASRAGADVVYAGRVGTGPLGDLVHVALERAGIPAPLPPVPDADTGHVLTLVEPDGERTFATVPGAEQASPLPLDGLLLPGDALHVHGYGLTAPARAAAVAAVVAAVPASVVVLLDPGPLAPPDALPLLLPRLDWWSGNTREAAACCGIADPEDAARAIAGRVRAGAVVRDGATGCVVAVRGDDPVHLPAPPVRAVDTTGAGDVHVGTFLAALVRGAGPVDAATEANAAAAASVAAVREG
ncbi:PfkB family carbohydrate kinase [Amnibacterium sp. CER49]|uniref:PfkB family carbohydrate kinase n=1 Tax=Amnibacterium sp. CER49 TaxID=3039161 RepID=UPI0024486681|nr:PfkB family carbohydrate kinase [Amnibacterium sp. CER49]MDH2443968.1 PfkB family carbohydrate kinase [Amnibacterium sp. CER49]